MSMSRNARRAGSLTLLVLLLSCLLLYLMYLPRFHLVHQDLAKLQTNLDITLEQPADTPALSKREIYKIATGRTFADPKHKVGIEYWLLSGQDRYQKRPVYIVTLYGHFPVKGVPSSKPGDAPPDHTESNLVYDANTGQQLFGFRYR
ncbi:hypothetical protein CBW65_13130 [Tumebacillus avium]|uniref:Uncharacterized protein n=1 Tax=Tumebacillus avium TaxID=1903704 RepID=A0A1Y0IMW4_9BACL|nr:hypothetical protein [Tumebacillus avium]ARU61868.1 hypothetical protein CBW65_13130 [Tumebacillus avium]